MKQPKIGLVLSGGGARSAYQAGVLLGLHELLEKSHGEKLALPVICGISGGAINGSYLASRVGEVPDAIHDLWKNWEEIKIDDVMDASALQVIGTATKLVLQLGFGGMLNARPTTQLLNASSLIRYLQKKIKFGRIQENINSGDLHGLAITATHYGTGSTVTFFDGSRELQPWMRSNRIGVRANLNLKHVLASSAIPLLFPPVKIQSAFYGEGAIRMGSPLSPAIHLGADKVIAIGVRYYRTPMETFELNQSFRMRSIQLADISGVLLNSMFLDALDSDLERMMRINQTLDLLSDKERREHPEKLRKIPVLAIRPSRDLGQMAVDEFRHFSWVLRHFLKGLGASKHHGADLISYLAFEKSYTARLLKLGYDDVKTEKSRVLTWFEENS